MSKQIDFEVAGTKWHWQMFVEAKPKRGDFLTLKLEPENKHDQNAVAVYKGENHIGYVPRTHNKEIGEAVKKGKIVETRVWLDWATGCEARVVIDEDQVVLERYATKEDGTMKVEQPPFTEASGSPRHRAEELRNFSDPLCGRSRDPLVNYIRMTGGHCSGGAGPC